MPNALVKCGRNNSTTNGIKTTIKNSNNNNNNTLIASNRNRTFHRNEPTQIFEDFIKSKVNEMYEDDSVVETERKSHATEVSLIRSRKWEGKQSANKTFSDTQLREIERDNGILLGKIMQNNKRQNQYTKPPKGPVSKITSSALNRRREQKKIDCENLVSLICLCSTCWMMLGL